MTGLAFLVRWMRGLCWLSCFASSVAFAAGPAISNGTLEKNWALDGVLWVTADQVRNPIAPFAQWCMDETESWDIVAIGSGRACAFKPVTGADLTQGLKGGALWLKFQLGNAQETSVERWLVVGHPQLQRVSAWFEGSDARGMVSWHSEHTGVAIPLNQRPVESLYPVLPITLPAHSVQTVYLRVASQNALDATTVLWQPSVYRAQQGRVSVLHTIAMGGMLLAAILGVLLYVLLRDKLYALFGLGMAGEVLLEGCRSGIVALFFWPVDRPFWIGLMSLGGVIGTVFLQWFVLSFAGPGRRPLRWLTAGLLGCLLGYACGVLWALVVDFRDGLIFYVWALQGLMLCGVMLIGLRIYAGEKHLWYLILAFTPTVMVETLRFAAVHGMLHFNANYLLAAPWGLLLLSPLLLLGMAIRSRDLHAELITSQVQSQARVDFLTEMSHELRGPLNSVMGYAQLLERSVPTLSVPDAAKGIKRSGKRLLGMIDEILDYARGQANRMVLDVAPVHWSSLVGDLQVHGNALSQRHSHAFVMTHTDLPDLDLLVDERRLRQILDNVLSNASRYGQGSRVTLHCAAVPLSDGRVSLCFDVSDQGLGIPPLEQDRVFEPFVRGVDTHHSGQRGLGLGLTISRQLAELMGGTLVLMKSDQKGSTFRLKLVCACSLEGEDQVAKVSPAQTRLVELLQALVVDDDKETCVVLAHVLQSMGFEVQIACSVREAIALSHVNLSLVLVDQFLLDGDGWMVLRNLKERFPDVAVVLVSAAAPVRPQAGGGQADFDACILKPVDVETLTKVVEQQVKPHWMQLNAARMTRQRDQDVGTQHKREQSDGTQAAGDDLDQDLQALKQLVAAGALTDIMNWATDLESRKAEQQALAAKVRTATRELDFETLNALSNLHR